MYTRAAKFVFSFTPTSLPLTEFFFFPNSKKKKKKKSVTFRTSAWTRPRTQSVSGGSAIFSLGDVGCRSFLRFIYLIACVLHLLRTTSRIFYFFFCVCVWFSKHLNQKTGSKLDKNINFGQLRGVEIQKGQGEVRKTERHETTSSHRSISAAAPSD